MRLQARRFALALSATTAIAAALPATNPAHAMDAVAFFRAIQADAEKDGNSMTFESLDAVGSDGARATGIKIVNGRKGETVTINEMMLTGTQVLGEDAFSFETMTANDLRFVRNEDGGRTATLSIGQVEAEGFEVPPDDKRSNPFWPLNLTSAKLERVQLVGTGRGNFSLNVPDVSINGLEQKSGKEISLASFVMAAGSGSFADEKGASGTFNLGEIRIENGSRLGQSGFLLGNARLGRMELKGVDDKDRAFELDFEGGSATNIFSPDYTAEDPLAFPEEAAVADIGAMSFSLDGRKVFSMSGGESRAQFDAVAEVYSASASVNDMLLDFTALPDDPSNARAKAQMKELGYDTVTLDVSIDGGWNVASGLLNLDSYKFEFEEMGALDLSLKLGGYTVDFARKLQEISNRMNAVTDKDVQQALSMQLLAEMSALTVEAMTLQVEDNSLTRRVMEMQAKQSGQTAEEMATALPFMAGMMLSQLNIPDFATSVSKAVGTFLTSSLDDRGSIAITAKPDEPVSFAEIMGIAAGARAGNVEAQEIIDRLNLSVEGR